MFRCPERFFYSFVSACRLVLGPPNLTASEAVNPTAPLEESHEPPARPVERGLKKSSQYDEILKS